ncbi:IS256 family transposase [Olsenella sp. Marseille-P4559]|uniref:IS256 family transposase n=1 Tax=Olsenella sp. Marseille-P4559 TaxID=2364795 RepID=UPI001030562B|nr:IS256 family transposase [Olsenella sp. Marseille-P4559]
MDIISEAAMTAMRMPRFEDGTINLQELIRQLTETVVNGVMDAEADGMCAAQGNGGSGYRERRLATCVGTTTMRVPKLRTGSFLPEDVIGRCQRVDRALVAAVSETCATGTSTRKVQGIAEKMGVTRLSEDQADAMAKGLDADVGELLSRDLAGLRTPYVWLGATYVRCRRDGRAASTAVVTAIGCDERGWRRVLGVSVVDTGSCDSWLAFLRGVRARGADGVRLVTPDAHEGLRRAIAEAFQGAAWQRCVVRLMRGCMREARSRQPRRRVGRIVAPVFRARGADAVRTMCHLACEMPQDCCPGAARLPEEAEPDALAYPDMPASHWRRLRTNNAQERTSRETKRGSRVVRVFPSVAPLERLVGAVMCDQDEEWGDARYFAEGMMAEPYDEKREEKGAEPPMPERQAELLEFARKATEASLGLADGLEAA